MHEYNITSGVKFTATLPNYTGGFVEAYINGLRLKTSEFSVTSAGVFTLTNTLTGSGNELQVVVWKM